MGRDPYEDDDEPQPGIHPTGQEDEDESTSEQLRGDLQPEQDYPGDREPGAEDESRGLDEGSSEGQVRRRSRDENMAQMREMARIAQEKADRAERELSEIRRQQQWQNDRQNQQTREERLALMNSDQKVEYLLEEARQQNQIQLQRMQMEQALLNDKISYQTQAAVDRDMQRLTGQVEQLQQQEMQQGRYWSREQIYTYLLGEEEKSRRRKQTGKTLSPGAQRQRVAAPNSRSDQPARSRGGRPQTLEEREEALSKYRF